MLFQYPRSLFDIAVRDEAKQALADARPQACEKPEAYSLEYGEDFSRPRTKQMRCILRRSRKVDVG